MCGIVTGVPLNAMVKKLLFCIILMVFFGGVLHAQGPHELRIGISGPAAGTRHVFDFASRFFYAGTDLYCLYEESLQLDSAPVFSVDYSYTLKGWLRPGLEFSLGFMRVNSIPPRAFPDREIQSCSQQYYSLLPFVNLMALDEPHFKIYGKIGVGGQLTAGEWKGKSFYPAWQIAPLGLQWGGERIFGFFELGFGDVYIARGGVGFRW